jgi:UDPglucose 6-dehydrogenase
LEARRSAEFSEFREMKIAVIGTGYVGLVAGTCFAESGNTVICVDIDEAKIKALNAGQIPIYEPGLEEMVKKNVEEERLSFTTDIDAAVKASLVVFIAVGTPPGEDGSADLKYVLAAARSIGKAMNGYKIVVDKSTVPVGTARKVAAAIAGETTHPFNVVSNPEFLKEGAAIDDFMKPDRVVCGTDDPRVAEIMKELYSPFVRTGNPIIIMDVVSAELTKYAANAMLATRISFMNEMANICERVGADGARGNRIRLAHRHAVLVPRSRLRRILLPEGQPRDHLDREGTRLHVQDHGGRGAGEHRAEALAVQEGSEVLQR